MKTLKYKKTIFGLLILGLILLVSFLYPLYGPKDFNEVRFLSDEKGNYIGSPPFPPFSHYLLGSDRNGADILYMLIYGAKVTLLTAFGVTFFRVLIGGVLGVVLSLWLKRILPIVKDFLLVFRLVPPIIILMIIMYAVSNTYMENEMFSVIVFQMIILVIMGVPSVLIMTTEIIDELKEKSFVQSSYLMGGSHFHVLRTQFKPYLKSYGLLMAAQQLLNTLVMFMFLGAFQIYVGGIDKQAVQGYDLLNRSISKEWAGLIGQNYRELYAAPWIVLFPLIAYFLLIILINMMKDDLESSMEFHLIGQKLKRKRLKKRQRAIEVQAAPTPNYDFTFQKEI